MHQFIDRGVIEGQYGGDAGNLMADLPATDLWL